MDAKYIENSEETPDTGSFMHLHLGIDARGLDDLDIHYSVGKPLCVFCFALGLFHTNSNINDESSSLRHLVPIVIDYSERKANKKSRKPKTFCISHKKAEL